MMPFTMTPGSKPTVSRCPEICAYERPNRTGFDNFGASAFGRADGLFGAVLPVSIPEESLKITNETNSWSPKRCSMNMPSSFNRD